MRAFQSVAMACGLAVAMAASAVHAQFTPRDLMFDSRSAPDLAFPTIVTPIEQAIYPQMMLLKPEGDGPFPAVMLGHQCGGLVFNKANPRAANWSMLQWAKDFQQAGYVALLVDFMGPRGATQVCQGAQAGVTLVVPPRTFSRRPSTCASCLTWMPTRSPWSASRRAH